MSYKNKTINWKPLSEYNGGRVLATNDLDILVGEINSDGDCISEDESILLCGITAFADIEDVIPKPKNMTLLEEVKNYLENASPEQLEKDWAFIAQFDNCGQLVKDFLCGIEKRNKFMEANEVINKLQGLIDNAKKQGHTMVQIEDIEDVFPELIESEDEDEKIISTIRKALEAKVEDLGNGVTRTACLAWLEKQSKEARNIALRTEYEKGKADAIAEMQKSAWNPEYLIKLADKYYDEVLIGECDMDEKIAHHCRLAYLHGLKKMLAAK